MRINGHPVELEIVTRRAEGRRTQGPPLLFVHGAYAGAWCWDEHFLPFFARAGYDCTAVSLRGHGASGGQDALRMAGMAEYVEDVACVAGSLPGPPVLIGHSMGGAIAQRFAATRPAAGLVLLGSVPPQGLWGSAVELWWRDPSLFAQLAWVQAGQAREADLSVLRGALFSARMPDAHAYRYLARMQPESQRALMDLSWMHLYGMPAAGRMPVKIIGAAEDTLFPPYVVHGTACAFGVEAEIVPDVGHLMMLDPGWEAVAGPMLDWLGNLPEVGSRGSPRGR